MFPQMGGGLGESSGTDPSQGLLPGIPDPQYPVAEGFFDEMMASQDQMRPHWVALMDRITALGPSDMAQRWERAERLIRDNGVTYNLYGDPEGFGRPWSLDPLPMIVSSEEWADIEAALIQRAQLLNSIIADLYGKRSLINESHLPASLLYANPGFLRPLDGAKPKDGVYLHFYAADLARSQDGRWWVVSDRTDAPAGVGYALENRIITSRILSDIYRESQVRRLAPFFMKVRETLSHLSPRGTENPRVVLWTPGPYNETHYEHVYLARYLGLTLVEGQDMTCRDGRVYLKTLDGLKQIDVILRRNEGSWCDPLELRGESHLGVPGLVEAVQSGNVTMANALGSRVVEAPGLNPFLESLCRRLLGEDLRMPSVATWWCGQPQERDHVLANLQNLIVRPSFNAHAGMISGGDLDIRYREALAEQIRQEPWNYIGQENFHLSSVPVWSRHGINPRQMVMRIQLVAHDGSYVAMPGGLSLVAPGPDHRAISMQTGSGSKDTWVLSDEPVKPISLIRATGPQRPVRGARALQSRVADDTYWLGRYSERCEDLARVLRKASIWAAENGFGTPELEAILLHFCRTGHLEHGTDCATPEGQRKAMTHLLDLNANPDEAFGLAGLVKVLRSIADKVRDRLSQDAWRAVSRLSAASERLRRPPMRPLRGAKRPPQTDSAFHSPALAPMAPMAPPSGPDAPLHLPVGQIPLDVEALTGGGPEASPIPAQASIPPIAGISEEAQRKTDPSASLPKEPDLGPLDLENFQSALDDVVISLLAINGLGLENMTRGMGWRFLDMGRRVERALHVIDLSSAILAVESDAEIGPILDVILDIADSAMTYRSRYHALPSYLPVLDVLLFDESNPRALAYQLVRMAGHVDSLATDQAFDLRTEEQRRMVALVAQVQTVDPLSLSRESEDNGKRYLGDFLAELRGGLIELSEILSLRYFAHAVERRTDYTLHPDLLAVTDEAAEQEKTPILPVADPEEEDGPEETTSPEEAGLAELAPEAEAALARSGSEAKAEGSRSDSADEQDGLDPDLLEAQGTPAQTTSGPVVESPS